MILFLFRIVLIFVYSEPVHKSSSRTGFSVFCFKYVKTTLNILANSTFFISDASFISFTEEFSTLRRESLLFPTIRDLSFAFSLLETVYKCSVLYRIALIRELFLLLLFVWLKNYFYLFY